MKRRVFCGLAAACILLLSGCTPGSDNVASSEDSKGSGLPEFTSAQKIRDEIARSESAISTSAHTLSSLATDCTPCAQVLNTVAADATARLQLDGGLWDPWPKAQSGDDLPEPAEVGDAPLTPAGLAGYMAATTRSQLEYLASDPSISESETITLAATLAGRWASADVLADFYGFKLSEVTDALGTSELLTSVGQTTQSGLVQPTDLPTKDKSGQSDARPQQALVTFDCAATAIGQSSFQEENPTTEQKLYDSLIQRSADLIEAGVDNNRPARCDVESQPFAVTMNDLIGADIDILTSTDPGIRQLGAQYLLDDLHLWSTFDSLPTVTLGVTDAN